MGALDGRVALVTGAGRLRGIGRATAMALAELGADVVVTGTGRDPATYPEDEKKAGWRDVESTAEQVRGLGRRAMTWTGDVSQAEPVGRLVDQVMTTFGRLDVLVNNAGGGPPADSATASPKFSTAIITLNLIAPLVFAQRANAVMQQQDDGGVIINIASVSGIRPSPGSAAYGAAKAGLLNLTQTLAVDYAPKVRVVAVTAGYVETEQAHLFYGDEAGVEAVGKTIPVGRMAKPDDIGDVCLFLASPLARYVSGTAILAHGGGELPAYLEASTGDIKT